MNTIGEKPNQSNKNDIRRRVRTAAAATYCGSTKSTLEKLRVTGGGPVFIKLGRTVVYDIDDLDAWLETKRRRSTSDKWIEERKAEATAEPTVTVIEPDTAEDDDSGEGP